MSNPLETGFRAFSFEHLLALGVMAAFAGCIILFVRKHANLRARVLTAHGLALFLLFNEIIWIIYRVRAVGFRVGEQLPFQLCDVSLIAAILALWLQRPLPFELAYYFGLGGATQALLTPDLARGFPTYGCMKFFVSHGGILVGVFYLIFVFGLSPRRGSVLRIFAWGNVYMVFAGIANWVLGTNYGYLCHKPEKASLFDKMGPWPWYLLSLEAITLVLLVLLYLPWWLKRRESGGTDEADPMDGKGTEITT